MISSIKHCWLKKQGNYLMFIHLSMLPWTVFILDPNPDLELKDCHAHFLHIGAKRRHKAGKCRTKELLYSLTLQIIHVCSPPVFKATSCVQCYFHKCNKGVLSSQLQRLQCSRGFPKCPMSQGRPQTAPSLYRMKAALEAFSLIIYPVLCWVSLV